MSVIDFSSVDRILTNTEKNQIGQQIGTFIIQSKSPDIWF